jgi:hypothetical protein
MGWMHLADNKVQWYALVNVLINIHAQIKEREFSG